MDADEVLAENDIETAPPAGSFAAEAEDEPVEGGDYSKYNKQCRGADVGLPGVPLKYYVKPPYFYVGLKREVLKLTCCSNVADATEEMQEMADMAVVSRRPPKRPQNMPTPRRWRRRVPRRRVPRRRRRRSVLTPSMGSNPGGKTTLV